MEATRYEYDDAGRMVGSVTEREPEYSRTDVEALIAYLETQRVGPHGQPMSEATNPLADPSNRDRQWGYEVDVYTDFAAQAESAFRAEFKRLYGDDLDMSAYRFIVRRVDY